MDPLRIGITSSLSAKVVSEPDRDATQHRAILEGLRVEPVILHKELNPLDIIEKFALRGLIFSGGGDVAAGAYGGDESLVRGVDFRRDIFEFALMERAFEIDLPVFAVCRGMQVANVVLGGTLIEDLRDHKGPHEITIVPETTLHDIVGSERIRVNSLHHQAIDELGSGLRAVASSDDGVIEAIEFSELSRIRTFFIGVQWHPVRIPNDPTSRRLYARLVLECAASRRTRVK